jgi:hypothetical protein
MKNPRPASASQNRKPSDAELASRYLDLLRLRDEVRKAEERCQVAKLEEAPRSEGSSQLKPAGILSPR